jgi:protein gp37
MSQSTTIEWATKVWNPVTGCNKVSQGCKNCYAETVANRFWGNRKFTDVMMHEDRLHLPKWKKPQRVFVNSMSDLFHESVSFEFIDMVWMAMFENQKHTFMILTKRPERMKQYFDFRIARAKEKYGKFCVDTPLTNVWLGVSVENQETANERIPLLLQVPAAVRWLSCEPLLGKVDLENLIVGNDNHPMKYDCSRPSFSFPKIDWVVVGGESGTKARPMHPDWARSLRDQCKAADVPFFFKQWGEWIHDDIIKQHLSPMEFINVNKWSQVYDSHRIGKKKAGRKLDGVEYNEFPNTENHE